MSEQRIIKKYPNRRLYDTAISKYITLDDVRQLVLAGADFCVKDAKSEEDITRTILLQIIIEQEEDGEPIFTTEVLTQIIRFYGDAVQGLASTFLQRSLAMFAEQQELLQHQLDDAMRTNPFTAMTELTQRNLKLWRNMQESFFKGAEDAASKAAKSKTQSGAAEDDRS